MRKVRTLVGIVCLAILAIPAIIGAIYISIFIGFLEFVFESGNNHPLLNRFSDFIEDVGAFVFSE